MNQNVSLINEIYCKMYCIITEPMHKSEYYYWRSPVDEYTFCITFSSKVESYTDGILIHRGCPTVFRLGSLY